MERRRQAAEISDHLTRSHHEHFGPDSGTVKTVIHRRFVITVREDIYTPYEKHPISGANEQLVIDCRAAYRQMLRDEYIAVIEKITRRKVGASLPQSNPDLPITTEMFVLEPESNDEATDTQDV